MTLPEGLRGAKPQPKEGWTLAIRKTPLAQPYESHGKTIHEDVTEISWTARDEAHFLQDGWYEEFVLRAGLPEVIAQELVMHEKTFHRSEVKDRIESLFGN